MILYSISLLLIIIHFLTSSVPEIGNVFVVFACIPIIISFIIMACYYSSQSEDIEKIVEEVEKKKIEEKEAESLTAELKLHLTEKYPKFEQEIFNTIKPENVSIQIVNYPELKTSKTITEYVKSIQLFQRHIFNCDRMIAELKRKIRVRSRTCKLFCVPILPKQ